jgi:ATP-binding cassette subfamily B protein
MAEKIAYIPQKTYIFSGTVKENIIYGIDRSVSDVEIIKALTKANIYDEVENVLGGLEGVISEGGNNLSGGQKQRLALARLILSSPEVLIFDEATSALDNTNENIIQKNIEEIFADKTIITIAHRLTTLKNADRILVFNKGEIVQEGEFSILSQEEGLFKEFVEQGEPTE